MQEQAQALAHAVSVFKLAQQSRDVKTENPGSNVTTLVKPASKITAQIPATAGAPHKRVVGSDTRD